MLKANCVDHSIYGAQAGLYNCTNKFRPQNLIVHLMQPAVAVARVWKSPVICVTKIAIKNWHHHGDIIDVLARLLFKCIAILAMISHDSKTPNVMVVYTQTQ